MGKNFYELTNPQKSIWLTEQYYQNTSIGNLCGYILIHHNIDMDIFNKTAQKIIEINDSCRIRIVLDKNNIPHQYIADYSPVNFEHLNLDSEKDLIEAERDIASRPFNLIDSPLFTITTFKLKNNYGGLILNMHHLIADAWSFSLIITQITQIYQALLNNEPYENTGNSYIDYINNENVYLTSEKYKNDEAYWNSVFVRIPEVASLPSPKYTHINSNSIDAKRKHFTISKKLVSRIQNVCEQKKVSIFNFFMAAFSLYIGRVSNLEEFVIGTPVLNRSNYKEKNTVGMFISTVPFKINLDESMNFDDFMIEISHDARSIFRHQKFPYQRTLENARKLNPSIPNMYKILLSYQNARAQRSTEGFPYSVRWETNTNLSDDINIHIYDLEDSGELSIAYDYLDSKYNQDEISNIHKRILHIIAQVLDNPSICLSKICIVSSLEEKMLLNDFNNTYLHYDKSKTVVDLFEEQVLKTPNKTALIFEDLHYTYTELNEKANQLARFLIESGIKPGDVVGLQLNRCPEMMIGLIAILKTGAAYLPLDPEYPKKRIQYMLENSESKIVLTHSKTNNLLDNNYKKISIDLSSHIYQVYPKTNPGIKFSPENTLYIIYTSGSTGLPKGVCLSHKSVNNFINGAMNAVKFPENRFIVSITTVCFDIFVLESWLPLCQGLTMVLANEKQQSDISAFNELCLKNNVNVVQTTPSRYNNFFESKKHQEYLKNITEIMTAGEPLSKDLLRKFKKKSKAKIYNMYGPTETTVWSTIKDLSETNNITIGKPISNTTCYILDKNKNLLPPYTPGELYIGGDGVSNKGYIKRDDLNEEKFTKSPFKENEIIYNTNDLAMFDKHGEIIHLGRTDFQVKIRGYRVELGEIEDAIARYPLIKRNVVVAKDNKYLICYYLSDEPIENSNLIEYISKSLPPYMIPARFERLTVFPFTPNGKLDRKKLMSNVDSIQSQIETPSNVLEKEISDAIKKILNKKEELDINAPFFTLGLDSLGLIQLQSSLLFLGVNLSTQDFYKFPTIKQLAKRIDVSLLNTSTDDFCIDKSLLHSKFTYFEKGTDILGNVLVTGSNGFIGIHVVNELLYSTNVKIYCLVRGSSYQYARKRFIDTYRFYFNKDIAPLLNKRIFILNGDILNQNFGLEQKDIANIILDVNTIIHTAANVKHYGLYEKFKNVNIEGTRSICQFAYINKKRFIHISSISVSGNYLVKQEKNNTEFTENDLYIGQRYEDNVYVNSKYEAEKIVLNYLSNGLSGKILRLGIVSGRFYDGFFQKNISENAFYNRIKSIILLRKISEDMLSQHIEFTPIDYCSKAIVMLSKSSAGDNKIYHIYNHNLSSIQQIINMLKELDINFEILDKKNFEDFIINLSKNSSSVSRLTGLVNDFHFNTSNSLEINYNYSVNIKSNYTMNLLSKLGFSWPEITDEYIRKILLYMIQTKFI